MKQSRSVKRLCFLLSAFLLLPSLLVLLPPLPVSADAFGTVLSETDARVMTALRTHVLDDFNHATVDWTAEGGTGSSFSGSDSLPRSPFEGSRALQVETKDHLADVPILLTRKGLSLDLTGAVCFFLSLWLPDTAGSCRLSLTLKAKKGTYTAVALPENGKWQTVLFDLNDSGLSGKLSSVTLSLLAEGEGDFTFFLDDCGISSKKNAVFGAAYMADSYTAAGCTLSPDISSSLGVSLSGEGQYIEAVTPLLTDYTGGAGIKVRYDNDSTCRSVTLSYTTIGSPDYTGRMSVTRSVSSGKGSVIFPIPDSYIVSYRLTFEGDCTGLFAIGGITSAACFTSPLTAGELTECTVSRDRTSVTVKGALFDEVRSRYADCPLYLYRLAMYEESSDLSLERTAAAEAVLNGNGFSFVFPVKDRNEVLFSKYGAAVLYGGALYPVGSPISVTNPEVFADTAEVLHPETPKGIYPAEDVTGLDGIGHTAVEILADDLITLGTDRVISYTVGDTVLSLRRSYVEELDRQMLRYDSTGIAVNIILRLGKAEDASLYSLLCHPASSRTAAYHGFNTADDNGIRTLGAIVLFLTERYASGNGITGNAESITVGAGINDAANCYNLSDMAFLPFIRACSSALRIVYNAARSVNSGISVYLPLTGSWYMGMGPAVTGSFDASSVLSAVSACIRAGGDIGWKVSYDMASGDGYLPWEASPDLSEEAKVISASNLSVLVQALSKVEMLYGGAPRQIMLLETRQRQLADANALIESAAEFVYTYLRISSRSFDTVKIYIPAHPVDYEEVLRCIDTDACEEKTAFAGEIMGKELYSLLLAEANRRTVRTVRETEFSVGIPSAVKGESVLYGFADDSSGFSSFTGCTNLKGTTSLGDREGLLSAVLDALPADSYHTFGIRAPRPTDLSAADYLGFDLQIIGLPAGSTAEITLVMQGENSIFSSSGPVRGGEWTTLVCDLSDFGGKSAFTGMTFCIRGIDGTAVGEPTLLLGSIRAMSTVHTGKDLETAIREKEEITGRRTVKLSFVVILSCLIFAAGAAEVIRMIRRRRYNRKIS